MNISSIGLKLLVRAQHTSMQIRLILVVGVSVIIASGCASNYSPRADLSTVQTIGVVVPQGSSEPSSAKDVMRLYNLSVGEDRLKNSAVGAGTGAAVGSAAGVGAGALIGCSGGLGLAPICWTFVIVAGALLGGTTGAVAGATVDTQEKVDAAPVHLYEINQVLPQLTQSYFASSVLQKRALQMVREQVASTNFVPVSWNGERYAPSDFAGHKTITTNINLVLTEMNVTISGKAKEDPKLMLQINLQWALTKYNSETQKDEIWDAFSGSYESDKYRLSEWLFDEGKLLKIEADTGLDKALTYAFSDLPRMTRR